MPVCGHCPEATNTPFHNALKRHQQRDTPYQRNMMQFLLPFADALLSSTVPRVTYVVDALLAINGDAVLDAASLVQTLAGTCFARLRGVVVQGNQLHAPHPSNVAPVHAKIADMAPLWSALMRLNQQVSDALDADPDVGNSAGLAAARSDVNAVWTLAMSPVLLAVLGVETQLVRRMQKDVCDPFTPAGLQRLSANCLRLVELCAKMCQCVCLCALCVVCQC